MLNVDVLYEEHRKFIKNNKLLLKSKQRFKSVKNNLFTGEVNKIALSVAITHKFLRLTLVFLWNSTQWEKSNICFSRVFC